MLFIQYPKCSTCIKAKKYLTENNADFIDRNITEETPTVEELKKWVALSGLPIQKFFNTSGLVYKNNNYKEKLKTMSDDEKLAALAGNGMLIKRPLLIHEERVLVGFKEEAYASLIEEMKHGK